LEFHIPFQHKYGYIRDDVVMDRVSCDGLARRAGEPSAWWQCLLQARSTRPHLFHRLRLSTSRSLQYVCPSHFARACTSV